LPQAAVKELTKTEVDAIDHGQIIREKLAKIEASISWVKCPWCREECVALYRGICIDCNRDVRGFLQAQRHMAIDHMRIDIEVKKLAQEVPKEYRAPEAFLAILTCGMRKFYAECETKLDMPIKLLSENEADNKTEQNKDGKLVVYHRSVFDAWKALKKFLDPMGWDEDPPPY
jgi:hypothetical protein